MESTIIGICGEKITIDRDINELNDGSKIITINIKDEESSLSIILCRDNVIDLMDALNNKLKYLQ